jgi:pilus assembly protein CpaB
VLVAARDVPQGHRLRDGDLRLDHWPSANAEAAHAIIGQPGDATMAGVLGMATRRPLLKGEPILQTALFAPGTAAGFMPEMIMPGKKAVGITVTAASSASGFVLPGDAVDVILTIDLHKAEVNLPDAGRFASETILRNVRVLAVDQALNQANAPTLKKKPRSGEAKAAEGPSQNDEQAIVGKTVAIEVTPEQAEHVLAAEAAGTLSLVLRSLAVEEVADGETGSVRPRAEISQVLRMATGGGVKVIKGGQVVH